VGFQPNFQSSPTQAKQARRHPPSRSRVAKYSLAPRRPVLSTRFTKCNALSPPENFDVVNSFSPRNRLPMGYIFVLVHHGCQRLGVWRVWESVLRFRPPTKTPERAKPLRSSYVNPHWLHPLLAVGFIDFYIILKLFLKTH